jgi:hypothetical protein
MGRARRSMLVNNNTN